MTPENIGYLLDAMEKSTAGQEAVCNQLDKLTEAINEAAEINSKLADSMTQLLTELQAEAQAKRHF